MNKEKKCRQSLKEKGFINGNVGKKGSEGRRFGEA